VSTDPQTILVAVPTYRRPGQLAGGLRLILAQVGRLSEQTDGQFRGEVVVIDNDPEATARDVVTTLDDDGLHYVVEPQPGISAARNRALDEAKNADLLVFLDDDEQPRDGWLLALLGAWQGSGAAAVMGRVFSQLEGELDPWVQAGQFFERPRMPTGRSITVAAAGNLLLDMRQIRELDVRFDERLGLTGGEDTLFSRTLANRGGRMVWCDESVADDYVPADRMTRSWLLKRAWSHGNAASLVELYLVSGRQNQLLVRIRECRRGLFRIAGGSARYLFGLGTHSYWHQARGLRTLYRGGGMVSAAVGLRYQEYARKKSGRRR
jgi:succinoglycan biosynthesis protein ExoM